MQSDNSTLLSLIRTTGTATSTFLQGQVTCDVTKVNEQQSALGAHCDAKGRIQATFHLFKQQEDYYFLLPKSVAPHLLQCLKKYAVFSKVTLTEIEAPELLEKFKHTLWSDNNWQLQDIRNGIPTIYPETIGEFTPHQINFQLINGISFNKGCYIGQEIIARMHYLGKLKQQMYRVSFSSNQPPVPGTKIYTAQKQEIGILVNAATANNQDYEALAVLQNDAIKEAIYLENQIILTLLDLPYTA